MTKSNNGEIGNGLNKNKKQNKNSGYTLIEAIVYLIVAMFVVMYAMRTMSSMSKSYVKRRSISALQLNARDAVNIMARHVAGAGFKYVLQYNAAATNGNFYTLYPMRTDPDSLYHIEMVSHFEDGGANDSASIKHYEGTEPDDSTGNFDALEAIKLVATEAGEDIDYCLWYEFRVFNDTLYLRTDTGIVTSPTTLDWRGDTTEMALLTNVKHVQFAYSDNGLDWYANPAALATDLGVSTDRGPLLVRFIKMGVVVATSRKVGTTPQQRFFDFKSDAAGYGGAPDYDPKKNTPDNERIHRFYEQIVEVPNNGVY